MDTVVLLNIAFQAKVEPGGSLCESNDSVTVLPNVRTQMQTGRLEIKLNKTGIKKQNKTNKKKKTEKIQNTGNKWLATKRQ